jgi:hypothetical protein
MPRPDLDVRSWPLPSSLIRRGKAMLANHPKLKSVLADYPKAREKLLGTFIWLTFAAAGIAIIYWFSWLAGD